MQPRSEERGEGQMPLAGFWAHMASMQPRSEERGEHGIGVLQAYLHEGLQCSRVLKNAERVD